MYKKLSSYLLREKKYFILHQKLRGQHRCRVVRDDETNQLVGKLSFREFSALEVSGNKWESCGFKNYQSVKYPEFDLWPSKLDNKFDLVIAEQVSRAFAEGLIENYF